MMLRLQSKNSFYYAVVLHLIIIAILLISFDFSSPMPVVENSKNPEVINAMVMDSPPVPSKTIQKPTVPTVIPVPPLKTTEIIKPIQKAPVAPIKKQAIAILNKPALTKPALTKPLLKKIKLDKKIAEKSIQTAFEKEIQEIKSKSLQQQMQQEQKRLAATMTQQMHGVVDKYKALILQTISQHWIVPTNADKKLTAELLIRLAPGGLVLDVQLIKSSGDAALDRSARAAVFNASPLPVPTDSDAFTAFRQFVLKVKPENVLHNDSIVIGANGV